MKAEMRLVLISALGLLTLSGCQEKKQAGPSHATAVGEVLPGSVSDAMLPLDSVRSQPPLAPKSEPGPAKGDKPQARPKAAQSGDAAAEAPAKPPADAEPAPPPAEQ